MAFKNVHKIVGFGLQSFRVCTKTIDRFPAVYYLFVYVYVNCPLDFILEFEFFCILFILTRLGGESSMNTKEYKLLKNIY